MKLFKFRKGRLRQLISAILVCVLLAGVAGGVVAIVNNDTKKIRATAFSVGALDANGVYVESKTSIYTKELIECQGLTIEPDFEAKGTYKVFYYDSNKNFIGATEAIDAEDGVYINDDFPLASYARLMITPEVSFDDAGNVVDNFKIRFYEVYGYANDYKVTVNKNQSSLGYSNYELVGTNIAFTHNGLNDVGMEYTGPQYYEGYNIIHIDVTGMSKVVLVQNKCESLGYRIVDASGTVIYNGSYVAERKVEISLPDGSVDIYISINQIPGNYLIHAE